MFGDEYNIVRYFSEYFLDYREMLENNEGCKSPICNGGGNRIDDTSVHKALREAIANYLDLSPARTRAILSEMEDIEIVGENRNRKYGIVIILDMVNDNFLSVIFYHFT